LAESFSEFTAHLVLRPLQGVGGATSVYALCAVVLAASVLGLTALYRMVSVVVGYAERRSNFVAAVSHELKTPLTAIRMYGEMLRDGMVPSEAKRDEYYRHITVESERLSRLINNVLGFSASRKGHARGGTDRRFGGAGRIRGCRSPPPAHRRRRVYSAGGGRNRPPPGAFRTRRAHAGALEPRRQRGEVCPRGGGQAYR